MKPTTQTLVVLMENHAGALSNMVGLFAQRTINIDSLNVVATKDDETLSQLTLQTHSERQVMVLLAKQIDRLVDVISVELQSNTNENAQMPTDCAA